MIEVGIFTVWQTYFVKLCIITNGNNDTRRNECLSVQTSLQFPRTNVQIVTAVSSKIFTTTLQYSWFQTFAVFWMLYVFFWVFPRRLNFICRRFGTLCLFHLHRRIGTKMEQTECSETSAYKIQPPGKYPEENIQQFYNSRGVTTRMKKFWKP